MKPIRIALFGAVAALAALPALAQPGPGPGGGPGGGPRGRGPAVMFSQVDTNGDGRATWEEGWAFVQRRFTQADANHDGALTLEEAQNLRFGPERARRARAEGAAQQDQRPAWGERHARFAGMMFRGFDANRDGRVTLEEIQPFAQARFRALDANGDNAVTQDELPQRQWRHGRGRGAGGGPGQGPDQTTQGQAPASGQQGGAAPAR